MNTTLKALYPSRDEHTLVEARKEYYARVEEDGDKEKEESLRLGKLIGRTQLPAKAKVRTGARHRQRLELELDIDIELEKYLKLLLQQQKSFNCLFSCAGKVVVPVSVFLFTVCYWSYGLYHYLK